MNSWWQKVARRWGLLRTLNDATLVVRVACFAAAVPLLLRLNPSRLDRLLTPPPTAKIPARAQVDHICHVVDTVLQVGRPWLGSECLTRGLTRYYFLNRVGWGVSLYFGLGAVDVDVDKPFAGHCWLVKDGHPVFESQDPTSRFTAMFQFPGGGNIDGSQPQTTHPNYV